MSDHETNYQQRKPGKLFTEQCIRVRLIHSKRVPTLIFPIYKKLKIIITGICLFTAARHAPPGHCFKL
jgi:succinylglutamate desuccinylase